jgi:hypothetical protein
MTEHHVNRRDAARYVTTLQQLGYETVEQLQLLDQQTLGKLGMKPGHINLLFGGPVSTQVPLPMEK